MVDLAQRGGFDLAHSFPSDTHDLCNLLQSIGSARRYLLDKLPKSGIGVVAVVGIVKFGIMFFSFQFSVFSWW